MRQVRVRMKRRRETTIDRRDRVAPLRDLDPRDRDILRAKAPRARMAGSCGEWA
jgi:hypothetical protein